MSKSDTFENDFMKLIYWGTGIANLADNAGSSPLTNLYVALHQGAGPTESGDQTTNEATYDGYSTGGRQAVSRDSNGWSISNNVASNVGAVTFATCGPGTTNTITYVSIGTAATGSGKILWSGALTAPLAVSNGITPSFAAGELDISEE